MFVIHKLPVLAYMAHAYMKFSPTRADLPIACFLKPGVMILLWWFYYWHRQMSDVGFVDNMFPI